MHPAGPRIPTLTILSHPDIDRVGERAVLWDEDTDDGEALLARRQLDFSPPRGGEPRPLNDPYVSRRPIRFTAARFGGIRIDCTKSGTRVVANDDWITDDRVFLGVEVDRGVVLVLAERLALLLHNLDPRHDEDLPAFGLIGDSPPMVRLRREIRRFAAETLPVLLCGAAGSGKKTVARAIHDAGRQDRPYVTVQLADEPPSSIPELLGRAAGGTLVLDAVEHVGTELQSDLLRLLEADPQRDVRILAAADADLQRSGNSAGPLIEQLAANTVDIPALAKRRDDVGRLIFHFLRQELEELDALDRLANPGPYQPPWFPVRLVATLAAYEWPRNIRQLRRVTHQLARDHHGAEQVEVGFDLEDLLEGRTDSSTATGWGWSPSDSRPIAREPKDISEIELLSALRAHRWQAEPTAEHLGVTPEVLFEMIENFSEKNQRKKSSRRNPAR